jgi:hypothetical protein
MASYTDRLLPDMMVQGCISLQGRRLAPKEEFEKQLKEIS